MSTALAQENRTRGILWMLATMLCFISLDAVMKYALQSYSLVQVTWGRFFFATVFAALLCIRDLPRYAASAAPGVQLVRSLLLMTTTGLFNAGVALMPLATATIIMFLNPILVTLLSIVLLGEHVGPRRWFGIGMGFLGAVIVVQPWHELGSAFNTGALFLLAAAGTNAGYQIATRYVRHDDPLTSLLFTATAGAAITSLLAPFHWTWPDATGWLLLVSSGALGCVGHLCLIRSLRAAPASVVTPFSYSSILWATLFGFLIWGDLPDFYTWVGAALIVAAGLFIFLRERQIRAKAVTQ